MTIICTACNARPSAYIDGHFDVDVTVTVTGETTQSSGSVTLTGNGEAWGSEPSHWVSAEILRALEPLSDNAYGEALREIRRAAADLL